MSPLKPALHPGWPLLWWPLATAEDAGPHSRPRGAVLLVARLIGGGLVLGVNGDVARAGFVVIRPVKLFRDAEEILVGDGIPAAGETVCKERQEAGRSRQQLLGLQISCPRRSEGDAAPDAGVTQGCPNPGTL